MKQKKKWKLLHKESILNHPYLKVEQWELQIPRGTKKKFMVGGAPYSFVVVFAVTKQKRCVIIDQFYISEFKKIPSLVAGIIDDGELALRTAKRELLEEAGYRAKKWVGLGVSNKGKYTTGTVHHFLALNAERTREPELEEAEDIDVREVSIKEVHKMLKQYAFADPFVEVCAHRSFAYLEKKKFL